MVIILFCQTPHGTVLKGPIFFLDQNLNNIGLTTEFYDKCEAMSTNFITFGIPVKEPFTSKETASQVGFGPFLTVKGGEGDFFFAFLD